MNETAQQIMERISREEHLLMFGVFTGFVLGVIFSFSLIIMNQKK